MYGQRVLFIPIITHNIKTYTQWDTFFNSTYTPTYMFGPFGLYTLNTARRGGNKVPTTPWKCLQDIC